MPRSVTRYEKSPELSVEGFQASVTVVSVVAMTRRIVGVVGGVRSRRAAPAVLAPKATMSTIAPIASPMVLKNIGFSPLRVARLVSADSTAIGRGRFRAALRKTKGPLTRALLSPGELD